MNLDLVLSLDETQLAGAIAIAWILAAGSWDDGAPWADTQLWKDS